MRATKRRRQKHYRHPPYNPLQSQMYDFPDDPDGESAQPAKFHKPAGLHPGSANARGRCHAATPGLAHDSPGEGTLRWRRPSRLIRPGPLAMISSIAPISEAFFMN